MQRICVPCVCVLYMHFIKYIYMSRVAADRKSEGISPPLPSERAPVHVCV